MNTEVGPKTLRGAPRKTIALVANDLFWKPRNVFQKRALNVALHWEVHVFRNSCVKIVVRHHFIDFESYTNLPFPSSNTFCICLHLGCFIFSYEVRKTNVQKHTSPLYKFLPHKTTYAQLCSNYVVIFDPNDGLIKGHKSILWIFFVLFWQHTKDSTANFSQSTQPLKMIFPSPTNIHDEGGYFWLFK